MFGKKRSVFPRVPAACFQWSPHYVSRYTCSVFLELSHWAINKVLQRVPEGDIRFQYASGQFSVLHTVAFRAVAASDLLEEDGVLAEGSREEVFTVVLEILRMKKLSRRDHRFAEHT